MDAVAGKDAITSTQEGNWWISLTGWWVFEGRRRQKGREHAPEARRIRASKLAHERGGITKALSALVSPPAVPRDSRTLAKLRSKHPTEDPAAIEADKAQAEQRTGITAVGEQEQQPNVKSELLDGQDQISEMENLFGEATVKAVVKKANQQSVAGPSGRRETWREGNEGREDGRLGVPPEHTPVWFARRRGQQHVRRSWWLPHGTSAPCPREGPTAWGTRRIF